MKTTTLQIGIFLLLIAFAIGAGPNFVDQPILKITFFICSAAGGMIVGKGLVNKN